MPQTTTTKPPVPPVEFQEREIATLDASALVRILNSTGSNEFQKAKACQRAGELGDASAVPALAALLGNEHLSAYARYGLEPIADASAGAALQAALPKLQGDLLIGVIHSLGKRRDEAARPALTRLLDGRDVNVARAAAAALGAIGGAAAAKDLQATFARSSGMTKMLAADALLICAERMLAEGSRDQALAVYAGLSGPEIPKPARLAAMQAIVREETSIKRPR